MRDESKLDIALQLHSFGVGIDTWKHIRGYQLTTIPKYFFFFVFYSVSKVLLKFLQNSFQEAL